MSKPLRVAGEVDSYCTKCRMVLNHRIVSMKASKPHQVMCLTCDGAHLYRPKPPGEKATADRPAGAAPRAPRSTATTRAEQARLGREQTWEKSIAGRAVGDFKAYTVAGMFEEGDLIRHKKFGDGIVTRVLDMHKVEVLFRDEPRTLAQGMTI